MTFIGDLLTYDFLQRALAAALLTGGLCSVVGVPVVLRNLAMLGHGLAHVSFAGVAIGFAVGIYPLGVALALSVAGAVVLHVIQSRGLLKSDTALGIVSSLGFAVGVVIVSASTGFNQDLTAYLIGSLLTVAPSDLWLISGVGLALLLLFVALYKEFFYVTFNEEAAHLSGVPVGLVNVLFLALTAASIVVAARIVGILLVAALLVIPAATSLRLAKSFRQAVLVSLAVGIASVVLGMWVAWRFDLATGACIVLAAGALFVVVAAANAALGARPKCA